MKGPDRLVLKWRLHVSGKWFLLRSDGQVMRADDIANVATYSAIEGFVISTARFWVSWCKFSYRRILS